MKFWQVISWCETEHIIEVARHAEQCGYEGIILAEHIYYPKNTQSHYYYAPDGRSPQTAEMEFADPLISFAAAAAVTKRLKMMTGIYVLPLRHPIEAAKNMATLARLSNDRFSVGIGAGWLKEEFDQMGVAFNTRGQRMDEMLTIMRGLWSGKPVSHHGPHFQIDDVQIRPYPKKPVPVIGGGHSGPALKRSAQRCEGWYGPGNTVDELKSLVPLLTDLRTKAGLSMENYEIIAPLTEQLDRDKVQQLETLGVTGTVAYPFLFACGPNTCLDDKKRFMDGFAAAHF